MPRPEPYVTIILLTKNGERYLDEVLTQVLAQKTDYPYEVMAIDSGSTDQTLVILRRYPVRVERIATEQFNHGETRNLGARLARGQFVVYLTQDATPANNRWLHHLVAPFQEIDGLAAVFSRHQPRENCNPIIAGHAEHNSRLGGQTEDLKDIPPKQRTTGMLAPRIYLSNTSACYRREILVQHPFPAASFAEDAAWEYRMLQHGYKTMFQPQSMVLHTHEYTLLEQFRQSFDHARAMKNIFSSTGTNGEPTKKNIFQRIVETITNDWQNLKKSNVHGVKRLRWMWFGIGWHAAAMLGAGLGCRSNWLPRWLQRICSRQQHLQSGGKTW